MANLSCAIRISHGFYMIKVIKWSKSSNSKSSTFFKTDKQNITYLLMNPYPLFTLNHLTVPVTLFAEKKTKIRSFQKKNSIAKKRREAHKLRRAGFPPDIPTQILYVLSSYANPCKHLELAYRCRQTTLRCSGGL